MLKSHATELLNYIPHRITNAASEGLNSIIQLIKANARGLPNFKNFRIRSECSNPTPQNCSTTSLTASPMLPAKASTPLFNSSRPTRADYPTSKTSASESSSTAASSTCFPPEKFHPEIPAEPFLKWVRIFQ